MGNLILVKNDFAGVRVANNWIGQWMHFFGFCIYPLIGRSDGVDIEPAGLSDRKFSQQIIRGSDGVVAVRQADLPLKTLTPPAN